MTQTVDLGERYKAANAYNQIVDVARAAELALQYFAEEGFHTQLTCEPTLHGRGDNRTRASIYTKRAVHLFRDQIIEKAKELAAADMQKLLEIPLLKGD